MEDKIKQLESNLDQKLDYLNYAKSTLISTNNEIKNENNGGTNLISDNKEELTTENIYQKYLLNNPDLSDITKAYLSSYTSSARPELSDFSKAYMSSNVTGGTSGNRPELSNLTMEYLKNTSINLRNSNDNIEDNK